MDGWGTAIAGIDALVREATLFAAVGFLIGGLDDLLLDLVYIRHRLFHPAAAAVALDGLPDPRGDRRFAIFVAAWQESGVIGQMLRTALARIDHPAYRIYVGLYPNDPATIAAVRAVAAEDDRVRPIMGGSWGPTTKAANLNVLWRAMRLDEFADRRRYAAVVLHDAEDVVHRGELRVFDALIAGRAAVQIPVEPLVVPGSPLVSGHYQDEFAEAHAKQLVARQALGAALPLAGTGCAIARDTLDAIARRRGGAPFDATSLTEDYELGLEIAALGGDVCFARVCDGTDNRLVAVRAYFPATADAAIRQKTRWLTGIALAGWDRTGWGRRGDWRDHWMRMRDRRGPLAVFVLATAWLALVSWLVGGAVHFVAGTMPAPIRSELQLLLAVNAGLLAWRIVMRAICVGRLHGLRAALLSPVRMLVGNYIAIFAARHALPRYVAQLRGAAPRWDKTTHQFPAGEARA